MSELKVRFIDDTYVEYYNTGKHDLAQVYIKSEADKVIAELKAREDVLVTDNRNLLDKVKKLEERLHENAEHFKRNEAQIIENADKEIAGLKARIAELEDERRWRKFPDEKPTKDIKFLVINEKGFLQCCYYSPILHEFQIPVTHWMPLPSAPKVD